MRHDTIRKETFWQLQHMCHMSPLRLYPAESDSQYSPHADGLDGMAAVFFNKSVSFSRASQYVSIPADCLVCQLAEHCPFPY